MSIEKSEMADSSVMLINQTSATSLLGVMLNPLLSRYLPTVVLLTGLIGNLISFVILFKICKIEISLKSIMNPVSLIRWRLRGDHDSSRRAATANRDSVIRINHPTNINGLISLYLYLCLLTITDLCVIVFGLANDWLVEITDFNIKTQSSMICKVFTYVTFVSSHMSSSLVVVSSFIRCMAFYNPLLTAQITNVRNFRYVSLAILAFYMTLNSHFMWTMNLVEVEDSSAESYKSAFMNQYNMNETLGEQSWPNKSIGASKRRECRIDSSWFGDTAWPVVDKFFYCLMPFVLLLTVNSLILINLRKKQPYNHLFYKSSLSSMYNQNQRRQQQSGSKKTSEQTAVVGVASRYEMAELLNNNKKVNSSQANSKIISGSPKQSSLKSLYRKNHIETRFTVLLLSLSFSFLILTLPIVVLMVLVRPIMNTVDGMQDVMEANNALEVLYLFQKLANLFMYTNHSINFFIFYLVSVRFRKNFQSMFVKGAPYSRLKLYFKYSKRPAECHALSKYRLKKRCSLYA